MSWPLVPLSEIVDVNPRLPKGIDESQEVSFVAMASVSEEGFLIGEESRLLAETRKGFTYFQKGDVLLAKITPCFENGKCLRPNEISNKIGFGSTEFHVLRAKPGKVDSGYLFFMVWSEKLRSMGKASMSGAAGQKRISANFLSNFKIPLPHLDEQKRIAAILDKADAIRRKRQQAIQLADDFLRSVFLDMFGDPVTNPKGWEVSSWHEVLRIINGRNQKAVEQEDGLYPICGSGGYMARANDWLTEANSVIIGRKGNINSPILMRERFWNVDTAFGLEPNSGILSHNYLYWFCRFFNFERLNKAVTIPSLTKSDLCELKMPLPNYELQRQFDDIVATTEHLLAREKEFSEGLLFEALSNRVFQNAC